MATYGRDREVPLWLGSLKSNIGHAQSAAGVAGIIKMVQAMRHGVLPRTLHVDRPSTKVDWGSGAVELLTRARAWPEVERPRRAAVSSFGVSGTNAHVILEQAPQEAETPPPAGDGGARTVPWLLSAKSEAALRAHAERFLADVVGLDSVAVAQTLLHSRAALTERAVVVGSEGGELSLGLRALAEGVPSPFVVTGSADVEGGTVFVFPGQGHQWAGMGARLLESEPVFAQAVAECARALSAYVDWDLLEVLRQVEGAPGFDRVDVVQPASFAVMVALARLWQHYGVRPDAVVGHSQGEIAAAHVAGALSLEDAVRVVALRSQAIGGRLAGRGGMMFLPVSRVEAEERIAAYAGRVEVAAVNGPASTVVAGDAGALKELFEAVSGAGVRARMVPVDYASHTVHVEAIEGELAQVLAGLVPRAPEVPMYSTFRDAWLDGSTVLDASYWYGNLRHEVRFAAAVEALAGAGYRAFVEVSAHPVLTTAVQDLLDIHADSPVVTTGTLRRDEDTSARFHMSLATLHTRGIATDPLPDVTGHHHVDLPTYPFQHQSYWLQVPESAGDLGTAGLDDAGHPLLGAVVRLPEDGGVLLTGRLSLASHPWLADHAVSGTVLVPGAALVELAVHAGQQVDAGVLDELVVETPLVLPATGAVRVQVTAGATDDLGRRAVAVHARGEDGEAWTRHASGFLTTGVAGHGTGSAADGFDFGVWPPEGAEALSVADFYDLRFVAGYEYGPVFQGLRRVWRRGEELFADVVLGEEAAGDARAFGLHPALLDAALHTAAFADGPQDERTLLPFAWNGVAVHATGVSALRVRIVPRGADAVSVQAADGAGDPVATVGSLAFRAVDPRQLESGDDVLRDALFRVDWQEIPAPQETAGA
ncbi:acyltransferase domain-containing protein, partial [Streptomyces sp. 16-176A]|uniref:acyltransferase domain-containing protein n=1 Tax=Streptomyces sp. 16-176A TaxID=2530458 RepID=UPI00345D3E90